MKSKRLLKFYFSVDELNASLDGLITFYALKSMESCVGMGGCDEKIIKIAEAKTALGKLWRYLDGGKGSFKILCGVADGRKERARGNVQENQARNGQVCAQGKIYGEVCGGRAAGKRILLPYG